MRSKHPDFTYSYHFMSQAIIVFLLAVPFLHFGFAWVPYWSYLGVAVAAAGVFLLYSRLGLAYGWYLASAPVIFGVFMLLEYPLVLSVLFSSLLVWRFIKIRKDEIMHQENAYVLYTLFFTTAMFVFVRDAELFLMLGIQLIILLFGYLFSHLLVTTKDEGLGGFKFWLMIAGVLTAVTIVAIPLLNFGRVVVVQTWQAIIHFLVFAISQLGALFPQTELFSTASRGVERLQVGLPEEESAEQVEPVYADAATLDFVIWLFILAGIVVLYLVLRMFKRRFTLTPTAGVSDVVSYSKLEEEEEKPSIVKRLFRRNRKKPDHPIRELVFDFENAAVRHKKGRYDFETIEDWLKRTDLDIDMAVYQKVRYGNKEVTSSEADTLKDQLKTVEQRLGEREES